MRPRFLPVIALALLPAGCKEKIEPLIPPPAPFDLDAIEGPFPDYLEQKAIPQDRAQMAKTRAQRLARARAGTVEAYAKVGTHNPKWDAAAKSALEKVAVSMAANDLDPDAVEAASEALGQAVELGCDDPYVQYAHALYAAKASGPVANLFGRQGRLAPAARALRDSGYPPVRRAHAAHNAALFATSTPTTPDGVDEILQSPDFVAIRTLLATALREDPRGAAEDFVEIAKQTQVYLANVPGGRTKAYEAFAQVLADVEAPEAVRHWLEGQYHLDKGWAARGVAIAALVPEEKAREFLTELVAAGEAFEAAWAADPTRAEVAIGRIFVAGPLGDFDGLEQWFRRAMAVDGDSFMACCAKGTYLHPKWGGHSKAIRQFAARLAETRNWHGMLPFAGIQLLSDLPQQGIEATRSMAERDWPAVQRIFEVFLAERPDSRWGWSKLAQLAGKLGHIDVAVRAGEKVAGRPSAAVFAPGEYEKSMDQWRAALRAPQK